MAKRKPGRRHPCGKLVQPTARERSEIAARKAMSEMEFVQGQPHRRGFADKADPWLESELGRFCRLNRLRRELFDAALEWANIVRLYRAAWGAPLDERHGTTGVTGEGPSCATVEAWRGQMQSIEEALYGPLGKHKARYSATKGLVLDSRPVSRELAPYAVEGLKIVALELGRITAREAPFQEAA